MESEENQKQVSLSSHSPWKSLCDSHIPTAPAANADGKVEIQKQDSHFPTARFSLTKFIQKGGRAADRFAPAFRLIVR
jgi:hypothetical protein